jgi:8-oxo-dGTP pyrophosphatase MutT (NUDIX family)
VLDGPYTRRSARVLVVDENDRVLLLRFRAPTSAGWVTPGGGVEPGESLPQAAARELREEIGLATTPTSLGQPVAATAGHDELGGVTGLYREDFFFLRVATHTVDIRGQTPHERSEHAGHRWWQLTDLTTTDDLVYPHGLAPLLADLIAGNRPTHPRELPWHEYHQPES